jgi:hypothetical protein
MRIHVVDRKSKPANRASKRKQKTRQADNKQATRPTTAPGSTQKQNQDKAYNEPKGHHAEKRCTGKPSKIFLQNFKDNSTEREKQPRKSWEQPRAQTPSTKTTTDMKAEATEDDSLSPGLRSR